MSPELRQVVEKAYVVFSKFKRGPSIYSLYGPKLDADVEAALLTWPLRDISQEQLAQHNDRACSYAPHDCWWPYYLPRYFELIAHYEFPTRLGADVALQCLAYSDYRENLPWKQIAVIDHFGVAFFRQFVCEPVSCLDADLLQVCYRHSHYQNVYNVLNMLVGARIPLTELLSCWDRLTGLDPDLHLASFVNFLYRSARYGAKSDISLLVKDAGPILADWLATAHVRRRLEMAFFNTSDEHEQWMLSLAEERLSQAEAMRSKMR
jgi:hypothetical protein